jgi:hypothetical protein
MHEFCSAELLGSKYTVPCNSVEHLNKMYGGNFKWLKPIKKKYDQTSIDWSKYKTWPSSQIPFVIRRFKPNGKIDTIMTIKETNKFFKNKTMHLTELPVDENLI